VNPQGEEDGEFEADESGKATEGQATTAAAANYGYGGVEGLSYAAQYGGGFAKTGWPNEGYRD
jgi:hypothetical protein